MSRVRVFVSFDVENDGDLYERLREQSNAKGSCFTVSGGSKRSPAVDTCSESARERIREADQMIVVCGEHTGKSTRVGAELIAAREEKTPYFLIWGRRDAMCTKPIGALPADGMFSWKKQIVEDQIGVLTRKADANEAARAQRETRQNGRAKQASVAAPS